MAWNGSGKYSKVRKEVLAAAKPKSHRSLWLIVAIIIIAFCGLVFVPNDDERVDISTPTSVRPVEHIPSVQTIKNPSITSNKTEQTEQNTNRVYKLKDGRPSVPLNKMTKEERRAWILDAKIERSLRHGWTNELGEARIPRTIYKSATEQAISRIFTTKVGNPPPMIPNISKIDSKNLPAILERMSQPEELDGTRAAAIKETLNLAKSELKKYIDNGGDVDSFLDYYQGELASAYAMRQEAQKTFKEMLNNASSSEELRLYYDRINKALTDRGIKPINAGPRVLEAMGYEVINQKRK